LAPSRQRGGDYRGGIQGKSAKTTLTFQANAMLLLRLLTQAIKEQ